MALTAAEIVKHPGFQYVVWDLPAASKGKVPVANARGGPFDIAYEIHGNGPIHLVVSRPLSRALINMSSSCSIDRTSINGNGWMLRH